MTADAARDRLRSAPWLRKAARFFDVLDGKAGRTRAVGGIVRDTVLGVDRLNTDIDMATELRPEAVMERAAAAGFAAHPTGIGHGTVTLVAGGVVAEVTTLRTDVETFGRRARVDFGADWAADAARRDFTMNALYAGFDGELFDPVGGLDDCLARRVRFIGNADARIAEDQLRVYRYFRFCATHGEERFEDAALAACGRAAGALDRLSAERIGVEMLKLLAAPRCAKTLGKMREMAVLDADIVSEKALPALARLEAGQDISAIARIAVLAATGVSLGPLQKRWRLSNALRKGVEAMVAGTGLAGEGRLGELAYRFPEIKGEAITVAAALAGWPAEKVSAMRAEADGIVPGAFPLRGEDLLANGIEGKAVGEALRRLEGDWIESGFQLDRQALLGRMRLP